MPELALLWGIMQRAILDVIGTLEDAGKAGRRKKKRIRQSALDWIMTDTGGQWSFIWICEHLKLNKRAVRETIATMVQAKTRIKQSNVSCNEVIRKYVNND